MIDRLKELEYQLTGLDPDSIRKRADKRHRDDAEAVTGIFWLIVVALILNTLIWMITGHSILTAGLTEPYTYGV